ncbi:unnamed protein product [Symbiodinium microadriaticum]|nr:unnamed protein product [Symbiodinium sp. KB8]CAE7851904.1 unnamed protein product [Symbiodinium microadriaticum]
MADNDSDDDAGATFSELEELERSMGATPHDHGQGPPAVSAPRGPPPPRPLHPPSTAVSGRTLGTAAPPDTPAAEASDSDSNPARRWPTLEVRENNQRFTVRVQGPPLPDGRFERSPSSSSIGLSSSTSCEAASAASLNSLTWSGTSLVLEGPSLEESRGVLCGQFRLELCATCPNISSRSQGARVGALRRKLQGASWQVVQQLAHQYLTEARRRHWANWEYQATHERRPRSVPDDGPHADASQGCGAHCLNHDGHTKEQVYAGLLVMLSRAYFQGGDSQATCLSRLSYQCCRCTGDQAATSCNADAAALQALVAAQLQDLPTHDPHALHTRVNHILQQCVQQVFPPTPAADRRVSAQAPFRASAKTTWHLYALLRRPRVATIAAMLHKWKLYLAFARASRALRQQCKDLKRTAFAAKLLQAEEAAQRGDQRTLFQIVRSLTPSPGRVFSRLRDDEGQLLSKNAEVQALVAQGKTTYAQHSDRPLGPSLTESLAITDAEITTQLEATKAAKAVPGHLAPAAAWKLCASLLGPLFGTSFRQHFMQGSPGHLHGDLTDAQMVMLPKVGKSPHVLGNLRPIGLMGPPSKALAGALRDRMLEQLSQLIAQRPQFAYTAGRGTLNALLRIHMHVAEATKLFRSQHVSRFGMHAGRRPLALAGAISLSLDLSRAFDLADRCSIYSTLEKYQVPHAVVEVIQRLHTGARFVYQAGHHTAAFVPTNGLKQGCKVAPCLWVWYTIALFDTLEERLSEAWVRHTPTMFADDCWAHWLLKSSDDLQRALRELQILLCTLEDYKMRINFSKTAILLKLVGKQAQHALRAHTRLKQGLPHLVVSVNGRTQLIPIKTEHEYLGSKVSYHQAADKNLEHRLQAGQLRYHSIQKSLTGKHAITQAHRIRLWAACVFTSTIYSLAAVGLTTQGLQKWETRTLKHLRAIMRKPAHLTRITNDVIWQQAGLRKPGEQLLDQIQQARAKLELRARTAPDITTEAGVLNYLRQHEMHLRLLVQRAQDHPPMPIPVQQHVCQHCEAVFLTEHALRIHCGIKHPASADEAGRPAPKYLFDPAQHSVGGLPHCRACGRKFTKWQYLKHHIEVGACEAVGGASFVHKPTTEVELRAELQPPTQPPLASQDSPVQNLPLVQRPFFQASWARWESMLSNTAIRTASSKPHQMPSDSIMNPDGQGLNPEADIFRYVNFQNSTSQRGQGSDTSEGQPAKRPRPEQPAATRQRRHQKQPGRPFGASAPGPHQDTIKTLTKVIVRQEDQLAELRGDKGFCLFLREDPEVSILPALIQISKDWHARQDARDATLKSPLRTLLMACLIRRLRELMVLMTSTPESVKKLQAAEWMNQAEEWTYFKWSHADKRLVRDTTKEAIAQPLLLEKIDYLLENLRGDVVQKFTSRPRLNEVGDTNATTALFFLSISLRGPVAQQVHEHLVQLIGVSALMLIGASLKREIPRRAAIVQQLAEAVFH